MTSPSLMQLHSQAALFFECVGSKARVDALTHALQTPPTIQRGFFNA